MIPRAEATAQAKRAGVVTGTQAKRRRSRAGGTEG